METIDLAPLAAFNLDIEQYVGLWLVDETRFGAIIEQVSKMNLAAHVAANVGRPAVNAKLGMAFTEEDFQIAVIDIQGTMTKRGSSLSGAGSSVRLRQAIRQASVDDSIGGIVLRIDSPGGTVAGTPDLAAEVRAAAGKKPTWSYIEDLGASAAYWVASQTSKIFANDATAAIGSIGTFMALYDVSTAAQLQGIKAVVIRSGALKGAGFPGSEITEEQKAVWQDVVDKTQAEFSAGVMTGRKMTAEQVATLANGRVWLANDAKDLGLIDGISTFDGVLSDMAADIKRQRLSARKGKRMSATTQEPATYAEIAAICGADEQAFICSQLACNATIEAASRAWGAELKKQRDEARQAAATAKAEADAARAEAEEAKAKAKSGVAPLGSPTGKKQTDNDPVSAFTDAVNAKISAGLAKPKAVAAVVRENPELHQAYIAAVNSR
jgi:signal peptide peptidase SppA